MIQITLLEVGAAVQQAPNGDRMLILQDPASGITVLAPFPEEAAKAIGGQLSSGVTIASEISELPSPLTMVRPDRNGEAS